uniref:Plastid light harvesting protein n=1 Tax=Eucampia antarctica TaxID=49252 RepID=A0A7S2SM88_9STRA|eukprot:CAMPEP_0197831184 /NCGR_PEP_ID=MMETSP1437-20131217/7840_1 /TAXON_ID=49252 ORGANISM="Eucampia antarctica, Strain CCMP1452" /NCGR_SAMPLE_ID=MMETSP1437 /ASSEMBLY_ACC=CAM_ASM_001096 /LENGTH=208 /DNA_ID=CAMNT_0043433979 /DNA_START=35 /DNA_END=661 /DNA_ORIENTATION=+
MARLTTAITFILAATAAAFAPVSQVSLKAAPLNAVAPEKQIGVQAPFGFWDPLGFIARGPYGSPEENFEHYRAVEVKHGRVAMAATLGMLVQQSYHFTGFISPSKNLAFADVPNGLKALDVVPIEGWCQMAVVIGLHEIFIKQREGKAPGDFGTGYFGFAMNDQGAKQLRGLSAEISNGRLAMVGILGMFASEIVHNGDVLAETKIFG